MIKKALVAATLAAAASSATAGLVSFDFTGGGNVYGDPILFSESGLDLTVSGTPGVAVDTFWGLGVTSGPFENNQIDGRGPDETISFLFGENVELVSVEFAAVSFNDDFSWSVNGSSFTDRDIPSSREYDFTAYNYSSSLYQFGVTEWNDDYFISGITVNTVDVAEPGALALFGLGLIGLGFSRRKLKA